MRIFEHIAYILYNTCTGSIKVEMKLNTSLFKHTIFMNKRELIALSHAKVTMISKYNIIIMLILFNKNTIYSYALLLYSCPLD